jgi:aminopeptidase N
MKRLVVIVSFFLVCFYATAQQNIDALHYKYEIELNDNNDTIRGKATISILINKSTDTIALDLSEINNKNGKGLLVTSLISLSRFSISPLLIHKNEKLIFTTNQKLKVKDTATFIISYKGIPSDGLIISKNQFGKRTFFADNWPNRAHHWIPCIDDPADKASVEFLVTAPSHYQVVSNGIQVEESNLPDQKRLTHWKEDVALPTKVMVIGVADFAVQHTGFVNNCIPVSSWVYPENKKEGFYDYAIGKNILQWFTNYIGPYAYSKLANVQSSTRYGGMENAGAIFYAESTVNGLRTEERLFAHEIVHQWFGNHATEKSFAHIWLSEGFATYLTHVFLESKYGTDSLNKRMQDDREQVLEFVNYAKRPVVDSTTNYMSLLSANSYQKGSWVLHMLRRQLGDSVFHKCIREYYTTYGGKNADTDDFKKLVEKISGKELKQFFWQWLNLPVNPRLEISCKYIPEQKKVSIKIEQLQQYGPFHFPLEILLTDKNNKTQLKKLQVTRQSETFIFPYTENLKSIFPDPYTSLLFEARINNP